MRIITVVVPLTTSWKGSPNWHSWRVCSDPWRCLLLYFTLCLLGLGSQLLYSRCSFSGPFFLRIYRLGYTVSWGDTVFSFLICPLWTLGPKRSAWVGMRRPRVLQSTCAAVVCLGDRRAEKGRSEVYDEDVFVGRLLLCNYYIQAILRLTWSPGCPKL